MSDRARVTVLPDPSAGPITTNGPLSSVQAAELEVPVEAFRGLWRPENLERLARAYWRYLGRISLGLLRVVYEPHGRTVVLVTKRLPLLRFRLPDYLTGPGFGRVTWRIERGLLVARSGRGSGHLRITVRAPQAGAAGTVPETGSVKLGVTTEVANFYPFLRGSGPFARLGARVYSATQLRIHVWVTRGFLRSLARLDLPRSAAGTSTEPEPADAP